MKVPVVNTLILATVLPVGAARAQTPPQPPVQGSAPPLGLDFLEASPSPAISRAAVESVAHLSDADLDRYFLGDPSLHDATLTRVVPSKAGSVGQRCVELRLSKGGFRHYTLDEGKLYVDLPSLDRRQLQDPHGILITSHPDTAARLFAAIESAAVGSSASSVRLEARRIVAR